MLSKSTESCAKKSKINIDEIRLDYLDEIRIQTIWCRISQSWKPFVCTNVWLLYSILKTIHSKILLIRVRVSNVDYTVVELSTDPAPFIISKNFRFRVSWS